MNVYTKENNVEIYHLDIGGENSTCLCGILVYSLY